MLMDYLALLAYVEMKEAHEKPLHPIRGLVRDKKRVVTYLGLGPRFLHSTGLIKAARTPASSCRLLATTPWICLSRA
jgi:hypothetical protein